jgi:hypothetical protein
MLEMVAVILILMLLWRLHARDLVCATYGLAHWHTSISGGSSDSQLDVIGSLWTEISKTGFPFRLSQLVMTPACRAPRQSVNHTLSPFFTVSSPVCRRELRWPLAGPPRPRA